jgi:hypothetical protein
MNKPNLVALWEEHCQDEFEKRDVNATMATMVPQPYANHIPTMTGGWVMISLNGSTLISSSPSIRLDLG